ncbi:MAG: YegS/Rv2252/BmrU family lipid kinase [Spirochaetaceae bacterium]|nr:YegS/Rv2252/BmrU family lipid kinase [Spirochaetaceae bacterium]
MDNHIIVFNPTAGKGASVKSLPAIRSYFENHNLKYQLIYTKDVRHGTEISKKHAQDRNTAIIAGGGDGTCNEVINGLMLGKGENSPVFGVLPLGRGNDFAYGGKIPATLEDSLSIISQGKTSAMDVGLIKGGLYPEGKYFGNGIGIGFDTIVGLEAAKMPHVHDALGYVFGTVKTLIKFSTSPIVDISYNGGTTRLKTIQISIMNGSRMGGLFYMAPEAVNNDGQLDLCMVAHLTRRKLIKTIIHYTKGTQKGLPGITMDRSNSFSIKAIQGSMAAHADGETICLNGKELEVSCIPQAIKIIHR